MNRSIATAIVLLAGMPTLAMAGCAQNTRVTGDALNSLIIGNTVCANRGAEKWQEQHRAGIQQGGRIEGQLWDYKMGPVHPIDPSKQVGTWSISRNFVTYCYTGDKCYSYSVHGPLAGNTYNFCFANGTPEVSGATFKNGQQSCP